MNYRHQFHAGNFADVMKHILLLQLVRGMQRKEKGFLYLDTHAGRGRYDLSEAARGDTLARKPEHPDGIGRLLNAAALPEPIADYVALVRSFDGLAGGAEAGGGVRYYPGSPWIVQERARAQDRMALCEKHPEEAEVLTGEFAREPRVSVHGMDGYQAIRAMLPPLERRALVLIDPPFEAQNEFTRLAEALREGLRRMPAAAFVVWYPLTERARVDDFFRQLEGGERRAPTFAAELTIAGESAPVKLKGCGLVVVNPPWQIDQEMAPILTVLASLLAQSPGGAGNMRWIVPE